MRFEIASGDKKLGVKLVTDGDDVDIVVTDSIGGIYTVAYLSESGLNIPTIRGSEGIDIDDAGRIIHIEN